MTQIAAGPTKPFYVKLAMVTVSLLALGYILVIGKEILSPLLYSFLFSILLVPLAGFLERKMKLSRGAAAGLSVFIFILLVSLLLYFVGKQLANLTSEWPKFKESYASELVHFQQWIENYLHIDAAKQLKYVNTATSNLSSSGTTIIGVTFTSLSSLVLFLVFIMIDTFFFLLYRRLLIKFLISVFKEENTITINDIIEQIQYIIRKYIVGLLLEMAIVTSTACITFSIIGIRYAILLGFITGLLNIIPYIGIFTSLVLSTLVTIGTGASGTSTILVAGSIVVIHLVDSNFLLPFLVGSKVKINAFITLLGVIMGSMLWGVAGMFLAIPMIAAGKIIFDRVETMKPWGILLGDEDKVVKLRKINFRKKALINPNG